MKVTALLLLAVGALAYPGWQSGQPTCSASGCTNQQTPCLDFDSGECLPRVDPTYNVTSGQCKAGTLDCCCTSGCCCLLDLPCQQLNDKKCMPMVDQLGAYCKLDPASQTYPKNCTCSAGTQQCNEDPRKCPARPTPKPTPPPTPKPTPKPTPPPTPKPTPPPTPKPTPAPTPCKKPIDVAFLLDSSASIGNANWKTQLDGAAQIVAGLQVASDKVHVAAAIFSQDGDIAKAGNNFKLTDHLDNASVEAAIKGFKYLAHNTATGPALEWLKTNIWSDAAGARASVNKVTIVITDGHSNEGVNPVTPAGEIKNMGVRIIGIGVGNSYDRAQLNGIASTPSTEYVFGLATYDISSIIAEVLKISCQ